MFLSLVNSGGSLRLFRCSAETGRADGKLPGFLFFGCELHVRGVGRGCIDYHIRDGLGLAFSGRWSRGGSAGGGGEERSN